MWFSQETEGPGYFHKIIYNLGVSYYDLCFEDYYGGFNDCISSHSSDKDYWSSYQTYPDYMRVYKNANRGNPSYAFKGDHVRYDVDWSDEHWTDPPMPWESINDKVSSLDMAYKVR